MAKNTKTAAVPAEEAVRLKKRSYWGEIWHRLKKNPVAVVCLVFLVLLVDPLLAVRALLVYLAVQFIENQFIYPLVVGKSVGLSPLYTLVAAMIGGKLFGILGILFFIPLTAVVLELVKEDVCRRLRTKETLQ